MLAHFILVQDEGKRKFFSQGDVYSENVTIDGILFPLLQYSVRDDKDKRPDSGVYKNRPVTRLIHGSKQVKVQHFTPLR